jgi:hypothetical protein
MVLSKIKPELPPRPEVKIEYNDRSYQEYISKGFPDNIPHNIKAPHFRIQKFIAAVDLDQGPLERTVTCMVRLRSTDWNSKKRTRTEYLYYYETWDAKNWRGHPIEKGRPSEHIEGKYDEVLTRPKYDEMTGRHIENEFAGTREIFYIEFSKEKVDEIIKNSVHPNKSNIRYIVKFGTEDSQEFLNASSRNQFSYDMFVWPWDKLYEWQTWPVDDMLDRPKAFKSGTKLEFKPS